MAKQKVFVAMPCLRGEMKVLTSLSVVTAISDCYRNDIEAELRAWVGDSILPNGRNALFGIFYNDPTFTDLVYWDDDIACDFGCFSRLLSHPVDFVGATYRVKTDTPEYRFNTLPGTKHRPDPETGLLEVVGLPTGFLRITRAAADKLVEAYADREYTPHQKPSVKTWALFDWPFVTSVRDHEVRGIYGEDFGFCDKWRAIGGKVWLDPHMRLSHVGVKEYGMASLHEHLESQGRIAKVEADAA